MKILIADDEEAPREQLQQAVRRVAPDAQILALCENGLDAWDDCLLHEPTLCLLDIRMPGLSGLEVARRAAALAQPPQVVFVTAFGDHAISAFEAGAIDYLMKPIDDTRLAQSLNRARQRLAPAAPDLQRLQSLLGNLLPQRPPAFRPIQASLGKEVRLIPPEEVIYFESDNRYTRVVHPDGEALIRTPLKELLGQLDEQLFWQVHRSVLVNVRHISSAIRIDDSSMVLSLKGRSERLPVSRQFQPLFRGQ